MFVSFFIKSNLTDLPDICMDVILLFYRRGDPDKTDYFGNTCLHLAAARGHEFCVKFLVKFGCNIWSLDIDRHSARELAAINGCERILQFLDLAQADQELNNRKKSRLLREKAEKDAEKRCIWNANCFCTACERIILQLLANRTVESFLR